MGNLQRRVGIAPALVGVLAALAFALLPGGARSDPGPPAVNLDQCRNGANTSPADCLDEPSNSVGWVNGNAGSSNSHYVEGYSIPYRATMTDLPTDGTAITLVLGYDIKHSGKHALDYLTHFDRLEPHTPFGHPAEAVEPLDGVSGVSATVSTFGIPAPSSAGSPVAGQPTSSFTSLPASERQLTLFGGTISAVSYVSQGDLNAAQAETQLSVTFIPDSASAVLAWGGHIARASDWGAGNSASAISGSPFHMRLVSWTLGGLGSQDRSLAADAVFGTIEIVKTTLGGDATFGYSTTTSAGGGGLPGAFDLTTSGGSASRTFAVVGGGKTYTVAESTLPAGWSLQDLACSDPNNGDGGTTVDLATKTATIAVTASEQIVCTFTNAFTRLTPTVATDVHDVQHAVITSSPVGATVHDKATVSGSAGTPTGTVDFTVWSGNTTCSGEGSPAGTDVALVSGVADPSSPVVVPVGGLSFRAHYDGDSVYLPADGPCEPLAAATATLIVKKVVVNDNGGTKVASDFSFQVNGGQAQPFEADGQNELTVNAGTYEVSEPAVAGYTTSYAGCEQIVLPIGGSATCTITNNDVPRGQGSITVSKSASPTTLKEPGGPVTFSVTITNTSANVMVSIQNVVDDRFGDLDDDGGNGCFDVPVNLAPGKSVNCTFSKTITGAGGSSHVNVVTASGVDENGNKVSDSDDARVDITPRLIDLVIVKEATSPTPLNGIVNYSLTVTNKGPDTATNVQLADPAPAGITYLSANPSQGSCNVSPALVTCSLGDIAAGQTVTIAVRGRATTVGSHTNTATVTGSGGRETNPADNVDSAVTIVPAPIKPPTPKPKPKPAPEFCLALTVSPKMIKADGKPDRVAVTVTAGKKRVKGVKVVVRGAGVSKTARTNGKGVAVLRINPRKAGLITVSVTETNQKLCGPKRIGVVGVFLPPLTG